MYDAFSICNVHMKRHCFCFVLFCSSNICIDVIVLRLENIIVVVVVIVFVKKTTTTSSLRLSVLMLLFLLFVFHRYCMFECCLFLSCFIVCKWEFIVFRFPRFTFFEMYIVTYTATYGILSINTVLHCRFC